MTGIFYRQVLSHKILKSVVGVVIIKVYIIINFNVPLSLTIRP